MSVKCAREVRENWGDTLDGVRQNGERVVITRSGKPVAALVSTDDLALLELLEDRIDIDRVREVRFEGDERVPLAKVRAELKL